MEHFLSLRYNEVNFRDLRFLSYDVIKQLSKLIISVCGVFIPLSIGGRMIKIDQEMRELVENTFFMEHRVFYESQHLQAFCHLDSLVLKLRQKLIMSGFSVFLYAVSSHSIILERNRAVL